MAAGSVRDEFSLSGKVAVITGAASGIGRETARVLAEAGARTVIGDIDESGLAATADLVAQTGLSATSQLTNVALRAEIDALADRAAQVGGQVDVWVNAAGIIVNVPILKTGEDVVDRMLAVNLKGVYWGCAAAGRVMKTGGSGSIINLSSGGGESAIPGLSLYSLTKAAVNMMTRTVAKEFGAFGVRANAIAPGWVDTPMAFHTIRDETGSIDEEKREALIQVRADASPLGITGTPRDIALTVLYLASDASRFMTGQILRPNGGVAMP
jgi:3-oxoacyl-[acyl-carrier protein] reductase